MPASQDSSQTSGRSQPVDKRNQAKSANFDMDEFVTKTNERLKALEDENISLKKQIQDLKAQNISETNERRYAEQPARRSNLMISGLSNINESTTSEDAKKAVNDFLRDKLKVTEKLQFNCELIIPKKKGNAPRGNAIVKCKFRNLSDSNKIRAKRKEVINTNMWINDDLTVYQMQVVKKLVEKKKELTAGGRNTATIYANRYLIVKTSKGKESFFESDGFEVIPLKTIPGWKPRPTN
ncbi:unnamed protein product [Allacma fusca]|uniref:Uncharacterized protein n=1 Tax=Allacma fusca TaxID=39272 RepID=A0A8J2P4S9_9HEXA|nr:unnamed protein product [Allacma fusca]